MSSKFIKVNFILISTKQSPTWGPKGCGTDLSRGMVYCRRQVAIWYFVFLFEGVVFYFIETVITILVVIWFHAKSREWQRVYEVIV